MANVYVYSAAAGAGTGADWTNAYTTLAAACAAKAAGDVFWVAHDHAETQATAMTVTSPGTDATPCRIYCVNRAGSVPPVSADLRTTATISTTGANNILLAGSISECCGLIFNAGDAASTASITTSSTASRTIRLVNCSLRLLNSSVSSRINPVSGSSGSAIWENTTVQFGIVNQSIGVTGRWFWRNTSTALVGATIPTVLLTPIGVGAFTFLEGVDLNALGSGKTVINGSNAVNNVISILKDCKLGASVTFASATTTQINGPDSLLIRCDSGDTNYRQERVSSMGTLTTETTIVRTGGATDGTTPIAWKIVTTASSRWEFPFECLPISIWNETTGSAITVTIQGIWGGGAVPLNDEIWIDVEYLGTSGFPLASKATSTKADGLATGTNIAAGSGTWGGSTTKFAMAVTITPQEKGPLTIYVRAAKVSSTFYVDPKPVVI